MRCRADAVILPLAVLFACSSPWLAAQDVPAATPNTGREAERETADDAKGDAAVLASLADASRWRSDEVGDGVWLRQRWVERLFAGPQSLTVLEIPPAAGLRFDVEAPGALTRTSAMAAQRGALAALNGGFYNTKNGAPVGLLRLDGALANAATAGQGSLGVDAQGRLALAVRPAGDWPEVHEALGAGPFLLRDGEVLDHGPKQKNVRHPRSAIGRTADGRVLWLTLDGRTDKAAGTSHEETARILLALGCREALNLDGGGSSTLWVTGRGVCNFPCDNKRYDHEGERKVANALLLHGAAVVVADDDAAHLHGDGWQQRQDGERRHAADFAWLADGAAGRAEFSVELPRAGRWRVFAWAPVLPAAAGLGAWQVALAGEAPVARTPVGGSWVELGVIAPREPGRASVVLTGVAGQPLVADAVRWLEVVAPSAADEAKGAGK